MCHKVLFLNFKKGKREMFFILILIGLLSGILGSMGLGGGTVLIPLLSIVGIMQKNAQLINIFSFVIMSFFVLFFNIKNGLTKVFPALAFSLIGLVTTTFSSLIVKDIDNTVLKIIFGVFLTIVGIVELISFIVKYKSK